MGLLGLSALSFAASFALAKRERKLSARFYEKEGTPIERIANTILLYAVRDSATQIRLTAGLDMNVKYLIGDEWHEQMKIPGYVWPGLRDLFLAQSDSRKLPTVAEFDGKRFEFSAEFEGQGELPLETLTLTLLP